MWRTGMFLTTMVLLSGCVAPGGSSGSAEDTAHTQLEGIWQRDVDQVAATYADRYFDFGGGEWIEDPEEGIGAYLDSDEAHEDMSKISSWQELVKLDEAVTGHPSELGEEGEFFQDPDFELKPGDIAWFAPPTDDSPLHDGWGGLYREIDGQWRMVGGD